MAQEVLLTMAVSALQLNDRAFYLLAAPQGQQWATLTLKHPWHHHSRAGNLIG